MEILSRCGTDCSTCTFRDLIGCKGCVQLDHPFWGECDLKICCEDRGFETCGQCRKFPCEKLIEMANDPKETHGRDRVERSRAWAIALKEEEANAPFTGEEDWSEDFDEDEPEYEAHKHTDECLCQCEEGQPHEHGHGCAWERTH